jgi:hypothetical protein
MALLVAIGLDEVVLKGLQIQGGQVLSGNTDETLHVNHPRSLPGEKVRGAILAFLLFYALVSAYIASPKQALSEEHREAMAWVRNQTPLEGRFLVLSGIEGPGMDLIAEWFPALSGRTSVSTPQGREWVVGNDFVRLWQRHAGLQTCASKTIDCVETWEQLERTNFEYIYLNITPFALTTDLLATSLAQSSHYSKVYSNPGVIIYKRAAP